MCSGSSTKSKPVTDTITRIAAWTSQPRCNPHPRAQRVKPAQLDDSSTWPTITENNFTENGIIGRKGVVRLHSAGQRPQPQRPAATIRNPSGPKLNSWLVPFNCRTKHRPVSTLAERIRPGTSSKVSRRTILHRARSFSGSTAVNFRGSIASPSVRSGFVAHVHEGLISCLAFA